MAKRRYRARVLLREGVLDVQGKAIESSLGVLGISEVSDVRVGKLIEFSVDDSKTPTPQAIEEKLQKLCVELFSNPVIERYELEALG